MAPAPFQAMRTVPRVDRAKRTRSIPRGTRRAQIEYGAGCYLSSDSEQRDKNWPARRAASLDGLARTMRCVSRAGARRIFFRVSSRAGVCRWKEPLRGGPRTPLDLELTRGRAAPFPRRRSACTDGQPGRVRGRRPSSTGGRHGERDDDVTTPSPLLYLGLTLPGRAGAGAPQLGEPTACASRRIPPGRTRSKGRRARLAHRESESRANSPSGRVRRTSAPLPMVAALLYGYCRSWHGSESADAKRTAPEHR
ncbi:hypothetical protein THAOC_17644 [Thalassiosira oceanica]|uniref:Uncharacterized protein n=1 Tax=Thalassiosira oceanica TaxID=159749 RepID=K0S6U6_THAOC|nr:hypothetical protein THAOC_17644 [Thalassiosira oceanica]|eukprot:EJK61803.1 hypothetical protein THAOC_17644 [Thalassiosira oceanica]